MTRDKKERRSPERQHVMLRLLRRVAAYSLALAAGLLIVPRVLVHYALLGPDTVQRVASARQSVEVARRYGASNDIPAMAAAERELAAAEALVEEGRNHEARHAAERAQELAAQAQQKAIVMRDATRLRAKQVIDQLDRRVDELEELYSKRSKSLGPMRERELFKRMKDARAAAAVLILAWEQQDYDSVLEGEPRALAILEEVKKELQGVAG